MMANGELTVKTRDQWINDYLRWVRLRNPNAKTGPDEYYNVQARNLADQLLVLSSDARVIAGKISLQDRTGEQLDEVGRPVSEGGLGIPRPGATGASGALIAQTTASGADVVAGKELITASGVVYKVANSVHLTDGASFLVICAETGPQTNLAAGTKLTWTSPPEGCFAAATVDSDGLTGGHEEMGDDDYRELLADAQANPAASANDAEVQRLILDSKAHGIAVEKPFTYPCAIGPGVTGFTFTMRGSSALATRIPTTAQFNQVAAYVEQELPATDSLLKIPLVASELKLAFRVRWSANGWVDAVQWPPYMALASRAVVTSVTNPTSFSVEYADSVTSGRAAPQANQSIALFDKTTGRFRRKTIASVSGTGPWTLAIDTQRDLSDVSYLPLVDQWVVPWSDSLNTVAELAVAHVNAMGPGEITSTPPGDGMRMVRSPRAQTGQWPSEMDGQLLGQITLLPSVQRASPDTGSDYVTPVGSWMAVYLAQLVDLAVFPL